MTREEAINLLYGMRADDLNLDDLYTREKYEALGMSIGALENENTLIDRVLELIDKELCGFADFVCKDIPDKDAEFVRVLIAMTTIRAKEAVRNGTPLPKGHEWIPVSERLPEDGQIVLFCDIDDYIMIGYHVKGRPDTHFSQDGTYEDMKGVRAWMPLPEPYKAD